MRILPILALCGGCAFAFQRAPTVDNPKCTETAIPWVVDTIVAVVELGVVGYAIYRAGNGLPDNTWNAIGAASAVGSVVFAASAGNGEQRWRQCQRSKAR